MVFEDIMKNVGKALGGFGKEQVGPTLEVARKSLDGFGREKLGPALEVTGKALDDFGKQQLGSALEVTGEALGAVGQTCNWVMEHPVQTAMIAASGVTFAAPGLVSAPFLWVFGWGAMGVRTGSAAAAIQAAAGNVAAGGAFATLQSAAMGGYGGAIVGGLVRAGAVAMGGLSWLGLGGEEKAGVVVAEVEADRGEGREDSRV